MFREIARDQEFKNITIKLHICRFEGAPQHFIREDLNIDLKLGLDTQKKKVAKSALVWPKLGT